MSDDKIAEILDMRPLEEAKEDPKILDAQLPIETEQAFPLSTTQVSNTSLALAEQNAAENLKDIELARKNIENIIELGDTAVKEMVEIAKQSESPRAFEVVSTLMKTLLDANKDYVEMSTKKRYASEEQTPQTQVTNNNLILSTADLLKMMKGEK